MPRPNRKPTAHAWSGGMEPYNVAQKQYVCVMALYTKMTWATITTILGHVFGEDFCQVLVQNLFWQMKKRSSQVLVSMEKATEDGEHVKEILEKCERIRVRIMHNRKSTKSMVEGMEHPS